MKIFFLIFSLMAGVILPQTALGVRVRYSRSHHYPGFVGSGGPFDGRYAFQGAAVGCDYNYTPECRYRFLDPHGSRRFNGAYPFDLPKHPSYDPTIGGPFIPYFPSTTTNGRFDQHYPDPYANFKYSD